MFAVQCFKVPWIQANVYSRGFDNCLLLESDLACHCAFDLAEMFAWKKVVLLLGPNSRLLGRY